MFKCVWSFSETGDPKLLNRILLSYVPGVFLFHNLLANYQIGFIIWKTGFVLCGLRW